MDDDDYEDATEREARRTQEWIAERSRRQAEHERRQEEQWAAEERQQDRENL